MAEKGLATGARPGAEEEERTRLMLSLTAADKLFLKHYAADRDTTVAAVIHEWIEEHRGVDKKRKASE